MGQSNHILFIVNPNAGDRKTNRLLEVLENFRDQVDVRLTQYPKHSIEIVREELPNYDVFVAVGGDGTVNEVASALTGTNKKLAVYPAGSGNGFALEFGFEKDVVELMKAIESGRTLKTDVNQLNGRASIHVSGVGYDAEVAHDFTQLKGRGFWNYLRSTMRVIAKYKPIETTIDFEDQTISGCFFMINITNTAQFGYGARIAPMANPTDGQFDLVLVKPLSLFEFLMFSAKLFFGWLKPGKKLQYISCQSPVTITTSENKFHIDGEAVELKSPVKIEIEKGVLNVIDTGRRKFS